MLLDAPHAEPVAVQVHLNSEELAAYLDRRLPADERHRVEAHLAQCAECRSEVVEVTRVLQSRPRERHWYRRRWMIGAAAAAVLLFGLFGPLSDSGPPRTDTFRAPDRLADVNREGSVVALSPAAGTVVSPNAVVFAWRGAGADVLYRLAVTDAEGKVVWTESTPDTVFNLPRTVALGRGRTYYWYVDALRPDGSSATTGVHRFLTAR
jgi:anti-sigma factor RsiW